MFRIGPFTFYRQDLGDYMRRWILVHPWGTVRLHHILRSDADLELHDHPWNFTSIILWGGYRELTPYPGADPFYGALRLTEHRVGSIVRRRAHDPHRLVLDRPAWTLVFSGPRVRRWGFYTAEGWVPWREFTGHADKGSFDDYARTIGQVYQRPRDGGMR